MYLSFINRLVSFALRPYTLNLKSTFSSLFFMFFFFISSSRSLLLLICCTFCVITFGRCRCFYARFYFDHFVVIGIENELRKLLWQFFCVNNWSVFLETWTFEQAQQVLMVIFFGIELSWWSLSFRDIIMLHIELFFTKFVTKWVGVG